MVGLILFSSTLIIWIVLWAMSADLVKYKKGALLGVSIPEGHLQDEAVVEILSHYKKRRRIWVVFSLLTMLPLMVPTPYFSLTFSLFMLWIIGVPIVDVLGYVKSEKALRKLKKDEAWGVTKANVAYVDTKLAMSSEYKMPSFMHWLVLSGLSMMPLMKTIEWTQTLSYGLVGLSLVLVVIGYTFIRNLCQSPHKLYCSSTQVNFELNQVTRKAWMQTALGLLYLAVISNGVLNVLALNVMNQWSWVIIVVITLLSIAPAIAILWVHGRLQKHMDDALSTQIPLKNEDEACWYFGVFYYNPRIKKTFVNKRYGIGSTVNLATSGGKWIMGSTVLVCIGIIIPMWASIILEDFIPCRGIADVTAFRIVGSMYSVEIPYDEIKSLEWTNAIKGGYKTNGAATSLYMRGQFIVPDRGECMLYVYNDSKPYLVIERLSGESVIFSAQTVEETRHLFEVLEQKLIGID